ncbi:MAG: AAA family ATPase [Desulfurococcales archaeon]|nr:AAA family ATPase [Desulfurococcales archaeon]
MEGGGLHCFNKCTHPYIQRALEDKSYIFIYGQSGTGKTHLAFHIASCAKDIGMRPVVIATEPGTTLYAQHLSEGIDIVTVMSIDEMASMVLKLVLDGFYVVVDSINSLYRLNPGIEYARILSFTSAMLRESGGFATGQMGMDDVASGFNYIAPWARIVGVTEKVSPSKFKLTIIKPERRIMAFKVERGIVEWT